MGLVGDLSSARLRDELIALLEEGDVASLDPRGSPSSAPARAIHPHLAADDEAVAPARAACVELERALRRRQCPPGGWRSRCSRGELPPDEVYDWLRRLKVRRRDAERVAAAVTVGAADRRAAARRAAAARGGRRARRAVRAGRAALRARAGGATRAGRLLPRGCGTSGSRSAAPTWPSSAWPSRRAWGRSSPSSGAAS